MFRRHIFSAAIIAAIVLVCVGIYVVGRTGTVEPSGQDGTWNSGAGYIAPSPTQPEPSSQTPQNQLPPLTQDDTNVPLPTRPVIQGTPTSSAPKTQQPSDGFDFNALLAQLRKESADQQKSGGSTATYEQLLQAFQNAPQAAINIVTPPKRTPEQEALFAWGNAVGGNIQSFQALNPASVQAQIVSEQAKNRTDASKNAALKDLGGRYIVLGQQMLAITDVPQGVATLNANLGNAYVSVGTSLSAVADSTDDKTFLAAITAYNGKADALTAALASIATFLSSSNVSFGSSDPGAIFSFRGK